MTVHFTVDKFFYAPPRIMRHIDATAVSVDFSHENWFRNAGIYGTGMI